MKLQKPEPLFTSPSRSGQVFRTPHKNLRRRGIQANTAIPQRRQPGKSSSPSSVVRLEYDGSNRRFFLNEGRCRAKGLTTLGVGRCFLGTLLTKIREASREHVFLSKKKKKAKLKSTKKVVRCSKRTYTLTDTIKCCGLLSLLVIFRNTGRDFRGHQFNTRCDSELRMHP